jgi:pimeloyl-ACP methyl ester carboxylesterase
VIGYEVVPAAGRPWLTLVHGFSQNRRYFEPALPQLAGKFELLLVDLRGHGASGGLPGPFGIEEYADDLEQVLAAEGVERTHYWATHTGTAVGLVLALRRPELFERLVLEGAVLPGFPMPRTAELQARASAIARSQGVAAAREDWFDNADWFSNMNEHPTETNAAGQRELVNEFAGAPWLSDLSPRPVTDVSSRLEEISRPALLCNGERDLEEFKQGAALLEAGLLNSERLEIAGAGGFPLWERLDRVPTSVLDFLTWPGAGFSRPR